ncbi:histidinol-phosphatase [Pacificimonas flava]|uniref:Histidinol-phosphatase n=2 Tax=Pacificimonas TaxID=1960290 RepID=A0A219B4B6_9SPHN|nr:MULTISPECIES: histidinol-phosphatase [Pacificimonas]MBZ6377274.1 histidinol-phosphatase [Pacificimonas aurantium]OWV33014.1 histidinol-phosphatase [Pacificimonas flava]
MTENDLRFAHRLADAAAAAIRPYWRSAFSVESKGDQSPVTAADRAAELAMRELIDRDRPDDGIVGEEYGTSREGARRTWVLDPIDGTTSFMAGRPIFGTLIALLEDGWPVLGIIDQPIGKERWAGRTGDGTTFNGNPVESRRCAKLDRAVLATTSPNLFSEEDGHRFMALAGQADHKRMVYGGDCYNYGLLASGHLDIVAETGLKLHDFAALVPIVEGAGGMMTDWAGEPLHAGSDGSVLALGDPARLEDVLDVLR